MRALSVLSFVTLAVAGPIGTLLETPRDLERRDSVTATQLSNFEFYVQHAAAAYCNTATPAGSAVQCSDNACPAVEGDSATVVASFTGLVTGIGGYVATDAARGEIVISIRGSINVRNWITNFDFPLTSCSLTSGCEVHTGFQNAWNEISSAVNTAVASALKANPSYKIISTGHSLGAAVATLAAANMRKSGYAIDLYTYGSPRVGNDVFANFVTAQTGAEYRVTHGDDPVPRLPPLIFGFRHTSPEYWLDGGSTDITYTTSEIEVCAGIANLSCNGGTLGLDVIAHLEYFENVSACSLSSILKRGDKGDMTDEELEAKLNTYSQMDQEFVANMNNSS